MRRPMQVGFCMMHARGPPYILYSDSDVCVRAFFFFIYIPLEIILFGLRFFILIYYYIR